MASKNLVALIVGASRGIGRQVAIDLASNGYAGSFNYNL
jgi:short-subunit dehydrogenase